MFLVRAPPVVGWPKLTLPPLWLAVALPIAYFTAAVVTVSLLTHNTPIWISNSFVLTALLRNRRSTWPALLCLFILADYAQIVVTAKGMWVVGLGIVVCDTTEILLVATLSGFTETASLEESVWPIARLALVSLLVPMVSATGGAALLNLALGVPFGNGWENWYLATASGLVIVTPLLLCWTDRRLRTSDWRRVIPETLLLAGLVAIVGYLDFHDAVPGLFLVFPFLLLTTFQGRLLGATTAAAAVAIVAIWSTFTDHGPIATIAGTNIIAKIHYLQLYIAVVLLSVLPLAALLGHREKLAAQLRAFAETLEQRVKERTSQLQAENEARRQTEAALRQREARIRRLVDSNIIGIFIWDFDGRILEANDKFLRMVNYDREDLIAGRITWTNLTPPDWRDRNNARIEREKASGRFEPFEKEYTRKDGGRVPVLIGGATIEEGGSQGVAFVLDLSERKRAEAEARESEQKYREMQTELAHANRVATIGQLTASIAHEVKQPIAATVTGAQAAQRWLNMQPANLAEVGDSLLGIVRDGKRAGDIIDRIRDLIKKAQARKELLNINEAIREVIELARGETMKNAISVQTDLDESIQLLEGDRVQLQQVILNLVVNAVEAMNATSEGARELRVSTRETEPNLVLVAVRDSGPGLTQAALDQLFDAFYTTKPGGLGLGLSICRSIIEAHQGQLWATANTPRGAIFQFTLPTGKVRAEPAHVYPASA
jgi:PAS domain S-box-containing protein